MKKIRLALICLALFFPVFVSAQDEDDSPIKVDSSIVVVNATVSDKTGKQISGLKRSQFKLFVDGKEREIAGFSTEETPYAAVILLDTSGSMEQRVSLARSAAIQFLAGLRRDDVAAIYHFSDKVLLVQDFSNSRDIYEGIFELKADGATVLYDAIYKAAAELVNRAEKRKAIVVLSDGADSASRSSEKKALQAALGVDAAVYTVDMTDPNAKLRDRMQNQGILKNFSEKTGGSFVAAMGGLALRESFKNIAAELGRQFTIVFEPDEKMLDGKWHKIEVKVDNAELTVRTREGFNAKKSK